MEFKLLSAGEVELLSLGRGGAELLLSGTFLSLGLFFFIHRFCVFFVVTRIYSLSAGELPLYHFAFMGPVRSLSGRFVRYALRFSDFPYFRTLRGVQNPFRG